jgi:glycosyltransferase involved in cell wall biosynthesis
MTILILNWRDIKNPAGGGAEILTHEIAKRWVLQNHTVFQISSSFENAKKKEIIDGVQFIRMGKWWNVHILAFFYYSFVLKNKTDVIIDEVHWFPFFAAVYEPRKTVAFICEVADKLFFAIFPYPFALLWRLLEKIYLSVYKNVPAMVISKSTKDDLLKEGHSRSNIIVLPMGLTAPAKLKIYPKEKVPTLIYVARLNKQKGIFDTLEAFSLIKNKIPEVILWIVGSGEKNIVQQIKEIVKEKKMEKSVKLFGFVSEEKKFELLARAHLLISSSVLEGWGLTIPEAGLTKTPAVVYNTQGFRDIIENKKDGILVDANPSALAKAAVTVLEKRDLYKRLQIAAEKKAKGFIWEKTADKALKFLQNYD